MTENRRLSDEDIDRALASLVDGEPSRRLRASVMQRLGEVPSRPARPTWRLAFAGAAVVVLLAAALGIRGLLVRAPEPAGRASAQQEPVSVPAASAAPQVAGSSLPAPAVAFRPVPRRPAAASASGQALLPVASVLGQWLAAMAAAGEGAADAPAVVEISVTPLAAPDPLELAPLTPSALDAHGTPGGPDIAAQGGGTASPGQAAPAETQPAAPQPTPMPDPLHVAPITFESLKLERVDVPPLTLPRPFEPDIKGKTR